MSHRIAVCAFAFLSLFAASKAHADGARPPIGAWVGTFQDGSTVELYVQGNGDCMYGIPGATPQTGGCSWQPTSPVGGILTMTYYNAGFQNHAYWSVVWIDARSFTLSDPYFKVVMRPKL
jgi:hypothetical protein